MPDVKHVEILHPSPSTSAMNLAEMWWEMRITTLFVISIFLQPGKMSFQVTNTSGKAISLRIQKPGKDTWEDLILLPGIMVSMPSLANAHIDFGCAVDISFREKGKKLIGNGIKKTMYKSVQALDLPNDFNLLKVKNLYDDSK